MFVEVEWMTSNADCPSNGGEGGREGVQRDPMWPAVGGWVPFIH